MVYHFFNIQWWNFGDTYSISGHPSLRTRRSTSGSSPSTIWSSYSRKFHQKTCRAKDMYPWSQSYQTSSVRPGELSPSHVTKQSKYQQRWATFSKHAIGRSTGTNLKEWLKSLTTNNLDKTRTEDFKSKFMNVILKMNGIIYIHHSNDLER